MKRSSAGSELPVNVSETMAFGSEFNRLHSYKTAEPLAVWLKMLAVLWSEPSATCSSLCNYAEYQSE